jgi:hypothetical protein
MDPLLPKIRDEFKTKLNKCSGRDLRSRSDGEFAVDQLAKELTHAFVAILGQPEKLADTIRGKKQAYFYDTI